jgi:site-specific recombinase XerD
MLGNGANPVYIQMLLGHADLKTLRQYLKVTVADLAKTHGKSKVGK